MYKRILVFSLCVIFTFLFVGCGDGDKNKCPKDCSCECNITSGGSDSGAWTVQGKFYGLQNAFNLGLISRNDLLDIAYYHNGGNDIIKDESSGFGGLFTVTPSTHNPTPKSPSKLSAELETIIRKDCFELDFRQTGNDVKYGVKLFHIDLIGYYGIYDGYVAVKIDNLLLKGGAGGSPYYIDNIGFYYVGGPVIILWKLGE